MNGLFSAISTLTLKFQNAIINQFFKTVYIFYKRRTKMFDPHKKEMPDLRNYHSYERTDISAIVYRRIMPTEYNSLPSSSTSVSGKILSGAGLAVLICVLIAIGSIIYLMTDEKADAMAAIIYLPLDLAIISFSIFNLYIKLKQLITPESMVVPGEIVDKEVHRGYRTGTSYTYTIALHGAKQLTTYKAVNKNYSIGTHLLIVKYTNQPFIIPVPEYAIDYSSSENNSTQNELSEISRANVCDYTDYQKVSFNEMPRYRMTQEEYISLPKKMRSCSPASRGLASATWFISLIIGAASSAYISHIRKSEQTDSLVVPLFLLILSAGMVLFLFGMVFGRPLKLNSTTYADGIIIEKSINSGKCYMTVVFPQSRQYVQNIQAPKEYYNKIIANGSARLYFSDKVMIPYAVYIEAF